MALTSARRWIIASLAVWLVLSSTVAAASSAAACCPAQAGNYPGAIPDNTVDRTIDNTADVAAHHMPHFQHVRHLSHTPLSHTIVDDAPPPLASSAGEQTNTHLCDEQHQCSCTGTVQPANINGASIVSNHALQVFHHPLIPEPASRPPTLPLRPPNLA